MASRKQMRAENLAKSALENHHVEEHLVYEVACYLEGQARGCFHGMGTNSGLSWDMSYAEIM